MRRLGQGGIEKVALAYELWARVLRDALACRDAFDDAGLEVPLQLAKIFEVDEARLPAYRERTAREVAVELPVGPASPAGLAVAVAKASENPHAPNGVAPDAVSIPLTSATPQTLVLGLLREAGGGPMAPREMTAKVRARGVHVSAGVLTNMGTRLEAAGAIRRGRDGWTLVNLESAPVLNGKRAWGAPSSFSRVELAYARRDEILEFLAGRTSGESDSAILAHLEQRGRPDLPLNLEMVRMDLMKLESAQKVARLPGPRGRWVIWNQAEGRPESDSQDTAVH